MEEAPKIEKRWSWRKIVLISLIVIVAIPVSVVGYHTIKQFIWAREVGNTATMHPDLPACGTKTDFFTVSPIKDGEYRNIVPLGTLGPGSGHVFPTKHTYFMSTASNVEDQTDVNVYAPGDMFVTAIQRWHSLTYNYSDYYVYFSPCKDVEVYMLHLNDLEPKLANALTNKQTCRTEQTGTNTFEWCWQKVDLEVKAGELIAKANPAKKNSIKQFFDFGMSDHRVPDLDFANPKRWQGNGFDQLHMVCPFDYFPSNMKNKFLSQMADYDNSSLKRTVDPLCGQYMQDIAGTAQGVWFPPDTKEINENAAISLVHNNALAEKAAFSFGTESKLGVDPIVYYYDPKTTGNINRDFKDIKADGQTYCFEPGALTGTMSWPFRIILQLSSETTLKIEKQDISSCGNDQWSFSSAAVNFER